MTKAYLELRLKLGPDHDGSAEFALQTQLDTLDTKVLELAAQFLARAIGSTVESYESFDSALDALRKTPQKFKGTAP